MTVLNSEGYLSVIVPNIKKTIKDRWGGYIVRYVLHLDGNVSVEVNYQRYTKSGKLRKNNDHNAVPGAKYLIEGWVIAEGNVNSTPHTVEYQAPEKGKNDLNKHDIPQFSELTITH